jgi:hypothetical protein
VIGRNAAAHRFPGDEARGVKGGVWVQSPVGWCTEGHRVCDLRTGLFVAWRWFYYFFLPIHLILMR